MTSSAAPPLTEDQRRFEAWWVAHRGPGYVGFGRDARGEYLAEFARDAWLAWNAAQHQLGRN